MLREHYIKTFPTIAETTHGHITELAYEDTYTGPRKTTLVARKDGETDTYTVYQTGFVYDEVPERVGGVNVAVESIYSELVCSGQFRSNAQALRVGRRILTKEYRQKRKMTQ